MKYLHIYLSIAVSIFIISCTPYLHTPPTRLWPNETSPKPLDRGNNAVSAVGGISGAFGIGAGSGTLTYRRGLADGLECSADISYLQVDNGNYQLNVEPHALIVRAALKASLPEISRVASARVGAGIGFGDAGQYMGFDLGVNLGWHNPFIIPFLTGGGYLSIPLNTVPVIFVSSDNTVYTDEFRETYGIEGGTGLKFYLLNTERQKEDKISLALFFVGKITLLTDFAGKYVDWPVSGGAGMEAEF